MLGWRLGNMLPPVERMIARPTRSKATLFSSSQKLSGAGPGEHQSKTGAALHLSRPQAGMSRWMQTRRHH